MRQSAICRLLFYWTLCLLLKMDKYAEFGMDLDAQNYIDVDLVLNCYIR